MAFASVVRAIELSALTKELLTKIDNAQSLLLNGIPRLPKGIVSSSLAKAENNNLLVVCPTLEEAGRWAAQLEAMGWQTVNFYPTSEATPYDPFDPESEITWGQMQVLSVVGRGESPQGVQQLLLDGNRQDRTASPFAPTTIAKLSIHHLHIWIDGYAKGCSHIPSGCG